MKSHSKSQKVRNLILCFVFNLEPCQCSQNLRKYLWNICRKYWELSEYHYTLLPTSENFLLQKQKPGKNIVRTILILTAHLISSLPEWPKLFLL